MPTAQDPLDHVKARLMALNTKGYYLLVALTFLYTKSETPAFSLKAAVVLTITAAVPPLQDFWADSYAWLNAVRCFKAIFLWLAFFSTLFWAFCVHSVPVRAAEGQKNVPSRTAQQDSPMQATNDMESRLKAIEEKADRSLMEKDYIERIEKDTKDFYQTAFYTQLGIFSVLALIIGLVGKFGVDHIVQAKLAEASTQIDQKFSDKIRTELQRVHTENTDQLGKQEDRFKKQIETETRRLGILSAYIFGFSNAAMLGMTGRHEHALNLLRQVRHLVATENKNLPKESPQQIVSLLFFMLGIAYPTGFADEAEKELRHPDYEQLQPEVNAAATEMPELAEVLRKLRK